MLFIFSFISCSQLGSHFFYSETFFTVVLLLIYGFCILSNFAWKYISSFFLIFIFYGYFHWVSNSRLVIIFLFFKSIISLSLDFHHFYWEVNHWHHDSSFEDNVSYCLPAFMIFYLVFRNFTMYLDVVFLHIYSGWSSWWFLNL